MSISRAPGGPSGKSAKSEPLAIWDPLRPVRPPRQDIAAPPFPPGTEWIGGREPRLDRLVSLGPLLVHFFDFAQLNSVRALPYVAEWRRRYRDRGLAVLGVHSPRFSFTHGAAAVSASLPRLGIDWPVAVDDRLTIARDYGVKGWPSLFLWGQGGALRWYHLGEGDYLQTEQAIREQLEQAGGGNGEWPPPVEPLRPSDEEDASVMPPSPELFPGGSIEEPWRAGPGGASLEFACEAAGAFAAAEGPGELDVSVDDGSPRHLTVDSAGLHELFDSARHGAHRVEIEAGPGVAIHSVQFAPGLPG